MKKFILIISILLTVFTSCTKYGYENEVRSKYEAGLISDWIGLHLRLIRNTTGVPHPAFSRHFAYTGVALYETVAAADNKNKSIASLLNGDFQLPIAPSQQLLFAPAAANASLASMMRAWYSGNTANIQRIDSLEVVYQDRFTGEEKNSQKLEISRNWGRQVAASVIRWSETDGATLASIPYSLLGEGYWEPTPPAFANALLAGWGNNRSIVPGSIMETIPAAPIAFSKIPGTPFHNMVKDVYDISQSLTNEQKFIANFWDDAPNGKYVSAFGHWFSVLKQVLEKEKSSLFKAANAYLLLGISMNDATISCWKTKYKYSQLRPVTYIRKYMGQPGWNSFITTPNHPEYSAAHATLSGAAAFALEFVFSKNYSFTDNTYEFLGMSARNYNSFEEAGTEAGMSRLYGGIHFRPSIEIGKLQGRKVAENVCNYLKEHK